ncbi:protein phosphatase 2C 80 [Phlyctema vagabunda]|uniref:Protein phosphatase n=1 Tax=Phlyctema vagabunda TaxID=108571 RepID=A0ABR4PK83_9HELO
MRRSSLRTQVVRAIVRHQSRTFARTRPRCCPEVDSPTSRATGGELPPQQQQAALPFRFETGHALFAKRAPRPFPPPFLSPPSGSFSDPLSTHHRSRDRRPLVNGELIRGFTNGDDAVYVSDTFIGANDGVGAWSTRPGGHAGLWARLILHFWALEAEQDTSRARPPGEKYQPNPIEYLQKAYELTLEATSAPNKWQGTTTAVGAQLYYKQADGAPDSQATPLLYVTSLGDSQILVLRPRAKELVYKTTEQWHWFDCPRQLGTNSPDTPRDNATMDKVEIEEHDVVLAMSDGVIDNLWEHEIIENVTASISKWEQSGTSSSGNRAGGAGGGMQFVAEELMKAARTIAQDPFAESPFMEHAIEEGLAMEGGKLDDISVVAALCRRNKG